MPEEPRKRRAFWLTLAIVAAMGLYAAMFGPVVWLMSMGFVDNPLVQRVYRPIVFVAVNGPEPVQRGIAWWGSLGVPSWRSAHFEIDPDTVLNFSGPDEPFGRMWLEPAPGILRSPNSVEEKDGRK